MSLWTIWFFLFIFSFLVLLLSPPRVAREPYVWMLCRDFGSLFSFLVFLYVFWGASGVLSAGVLIGLGCS